MVLIGFSSIALLAGLAGLTLLISGIVLLCRRKKPAGIICTVIGGLLLLGVAGLFALFVLSPM